MHVAARPYLAAGVALVGASAIAISPIAPVPDVHLSEIRSSAAAVELSAMTNPLELWADVLTTASQNVGLLGQQWLADPAPILKQIIANQLYSANVLITTLQGLGDAYASALSPSNPFGAPATIQLAFGQIASGQVEAGILTLSSLGLVLGLPLISASFPIAGVIAQPFTNVGKLINNIPSVLPAVLLYGLIGPMNSSLVATGHVIDSLGSAVRGGDIAEFVNALVNAPATVTGAFLNGFVSGGYDQGGFLGNSGGFMFSAVGAVLGAISSLANAIMTPGADRHNLLSNLSALGFGTSAAAKSTTDVSATPDLTATMVSLNAAPEKDAVSTSTDTAPVEAATDPAPAAVDPDPATVPVTAIEAEVPADTTATVPSETVSTETDTTAPTEGETTETDTTVTPVDTKDGNKVVPATKAGANQTSGDRTQAGLNALGDQVGAAAKNFGDGIKKALGGNRTSSSSNSSSSTGGDTGSSNE
jgi:hypothetical protein